LVLPRPIILSCRAVGLRVSSRGFICGRKRECAAVYTVAQNARKSVAVGEKGATSSLPATSSNVTNHFIYSEFYLLICNFRPQRPHAVRRCGLLLQIPEVTSSVCLRIGHTGELFKSGSVSRGQTRVSPLATLI